MAVAFEEVLVAAVVGVVAEAAVAAFDCPSFVAVVVAVGHVLVAFDAVAVPAVGAFVAAGTSPNVGVDPSAFRLAED